LLAGPLRAAVASRPGKPLRWQRRGRHGGERGAVMTVEAGQPFPNFTAQSQEGETVNLQALGENANLVVFFYPKATTRGCVRETTEFGQRQEEFAALGTKLVGVSVDDVGLQKDHAIQCSAGFPLLCDTDKSLTTELGILSERGMAQRTTYLVDRYGIIRTVFDNVAVDGHVDAVLQAVQQLPA
jgi:thioredoxin-dependent peroxiredoxin